MSAKLELFHRGSTRATDSNETDALRWLLSTIFYHPHVTHRDGHPPHEHRSKPSGSVNEFRRRPCATAPWAVGLMISGLLFLPAELVAETGIDINLTCGMRGMRSADGICAGGSVSAGDLGIAANSLLVQRVAWVDHEWDAIFEGASKRMSASEVHCVSCIKDKLLKARAKIVAGGCNVKTSRCDPCGDVYVRRRGDGVFANRVVNASVVAGHGVGHVAFDGLDMMALYFRPAHGVVANGSFISVVGVECLLGDLHTAGVKNLTDAEGSFVFRPAPNHTRVYEISCMAPGITSEQFANAIALYRLMQLERPKYVRKTKKKSVAEMESMRATDAVKAIFAVKAEDRSASCSGVVGVYVACGLFQWEKSAFVVIIAVTFLVIWLVLQFYTKGILKDVFVPHDTSSWLTFMSRPSLTNRVRLDTQMRGGKDYMRVVLDPVMEEGDPSEPPSLRFA